VKADESRIIVGCYYIWWDHRSLGRRSTYTMAFMSLKVAFFWKEKKVRVWASVATSAAARAASPQRSARSASSATLTFRSAAAPAMAAAVVQQGEAAAG
jgi:hypothetical protein